MIFIHSSDELYGADRMLIEIVRAVPDSVQVEVWLPNDLDHKPTALCHEFDRQKVAVRHLRLPIMRRANRNIRGLVALLGRSVSLFRELRAASPECVYLTTSPTFLGAPLAKFAGVPRVVGHVQEIWSRADLLIFVGPALACHQVLAISAAVADSLPSVLKNRTVVIPNGTPEPRKVSHLDGRQGDLQFLVASRWNGWKGHRTLLTAWNRAGAPGRLTVLGGKPPSGASVDVTAVVVALGLADSVSVIGEVPDPSFYLEQTDVVMMPSDRAEPFGLVAIEAFARARPVIASAGGGLLDIVSPGVDGWLFPIGNSDALAEVLSALTRDQVTAAGACARRTYEARFSTARFTDDWRRAVIEPWRRS